MDSNITLSPAQINSAKWSLVLQRVSSKNYFQQKALIHRSEAFNRLLCCLLMTRALHAGATEVTN